MTDLVARLHELQARVPRGMLLGLDRVEAALRSLGDPHLALQVVHVGGTNGKGSTCAMIESIARAAGLTTGLYTSPHLIRFAERIRLNGEPIADEPLEAALAAVLDRCRPDLTFFESVTVAAFAAFAEAKPDIVVLEVGLGGRLDATNVVQRPLATAVTSIAFDHMAILGSTLEEIAREKAGIFKRGAPAIVNAKPDLWPVFEAQAEEVGAPLSFVGRDVPLARDAKIALEGEHQIANAAVARWVAKTIPRVTEAAVLRGLELVQWPARFERFEVEGRAVVIDCAHNLEGAEALARAMARAGLSPETTTLLFGALADKAFSPMLQALALRASRRVYTQPKGRKPAPMETLRAIASGLTEEDPKRALRHALDLTPPGEAIVIAGSAYLAGELRASILGVTPDPIVAL